MNLKDGIDALAKENESELANQTKLVKDNTPKSYTNKNGATVTDVGDDKLGNKQYQLNDKDKTVRSMKPDTAQKFLKDNGYVENKPKPVATKLATNSQPEWKQTKMASGVLHEQGKNRIMEESTPDFKGKQYRVGGTGKDAKIYKTLDEAKNSFNKPVESQAVGGKNGKAAQNIYNNLDLKRKGVGKDEIGNIEAALDEGKTVDEIKNKYNKPAKPSVDPVKYLKGQGYNEKVAKKGVENLQRIVDKNNKVQQPKPSIDPVAKAKDDFNKGKISLGEMDDIAIKEFEKRQKAKISQPAPKQTAADQHKKLQKWAKENKLKLESYDESETYWDEIARKNVKSKRYMCDVSGLPSNFGWKGSNEKGTATIYVDSDGAFFDTDNYNVPKELRKEFKSVDELLANLNKYVANNNQGNPVQQPQFSDLTDEELLEELVDNKYWYENAKDENQIADWMAERLSISPERARAFVKANYKNGQVWDEKAPSNDPAQKLMGEKSVRDAVIDDTLKGSKVNAKAVKALADKEYEKPLQKVTSKDVRNFLDETNFQSVKVTPLEDGTIDLFDKISYDDREVNKELEERLRENGFDAEMKYDKKEDAYYVLVKPNKLQSQTTPTPTVSASEYYKNTPEEQAVNGNTDAVVNKLAAAISELDNSGLLYTYDIDELMHSLAIKGVNYAGNRELVSQALEKYFDEDGTDDLYGNYYETGEDIDGDYERANGPLNFYRENDPNKIIDFLNKHLGQQDIQGSLDNAMERLTELIQFSPKELDIIMGGTGEQILDLINSKRTNGQKTEPQKIQNGQSKVQQADFYKDMNKKIKESQQETVKADLGSELVQGRTYLTPDGHKIKLGKPIIQIDYNGPYVEFEYEYELADGSKGKSVAGYESLIKMLMKR